MSVNPDFRDLFAALNAAHAEFLIIGGYALGFTARPDSPRIALMLRPFDNPV